FTSRSSAKRWASSFIFTVGMFRPRDRLTVLPSPSDLGSTVADHSRAVYLRLPVLGSWSQEWGVSAATAAAAPRSFQMFFMVSFSFSFSFKISSIRAPPSRRKGFSALGDQLLLAAHIGPQDGGDGHRAVGLEVVLQEG